MNNLKRILALVLALMMSFALVACGGKEEVQEETKTETETKTEEPKEEEKAEEPAQMTEAEELEAMKKEPMYEEGFSYLYTSGNCTSGPYMAQKLGYFDEYGLKVKEQVKGGAWQELIGSNKIQTMVCHISLGLVPATNGVNYSFTSGAMVGCQSLFVLADSGIESTADLKGKTISCPNGIGGSSYNIGARMLDRDGMDPFNDVEWAVVEVSACLAAMQNGDIDAVVTGDTWAYNMIKDGTLKCIRSITYDEDFMDEPCCVNIMNNDFIEQNPLMAKYINKALKRAQQYAGEHPEEMVQMLIDEGYLNGGFEANLEMWKDLQWGVCTDEFTSRALDEICDDYCRLDLITATDSGDEVYDRVWKPMAPENN